MNAIFTTVRALVAAVALTISLSSCFININGLDNIVGNGTITTQKRTVTSFTGISNQLSGNVEIVCKQSPSLEISTDDNILQYIKTEVVGGVLTISSDRSFLAPTRLTIKASTDMLTNAQISGSGNMTIKEIDTPSFTGRITGSGDMFVNGKATSGNYTVSGSGNIDARNCAVQQATASITGSGNITVTASQALDGTISGSGSIIYFGNPSVRSTITGSGRIVGGR